MRKTVYILFMLTLMVLGSFFFAFKPAIAQTGTTVFFDPNPAHIYINDTNSQVVDVWVGDVVEMNAFDITVEYDPAVVNLASWTTGTFLEVYASQCFQHPQHPIVPGYFRIICTQFAKPLKTGSGVLLKLTFSGLDIDSTALTLTNPEFSAGTPLVTIYPTPTNGTLNVIDPSNLLYLPLIANMGVQGKLGDRSGVRLSLAPGSTYGFDYEGWSTDIPGENLLINDVVADTFLVTASHPGCLSASGTIVIPSDAASYSLPALVLKAGNAQDEDEIIDVYDLTIVNGAYGDFAANPDGDVNFDGQIDARDLALVAGNFGLTSETAYAAWLP